MKLKHAQSFQFALGFGNFISESVNPQSGDAYNSQTFRKKVKKFNELNSMNQILKSQPLNRDSSQEELIYKFYRSNFVLELLNLKER